MSRQDVGESQAAPGTARPDGPAEILKPRRDRAAAGGQDGSPGSRGGLKLPAAWRAKPSQSYITGCRAGKKNGTTGRNPLYRFLSADALLRSQ